MIKGAAKQHSRYFLFLVKVPGLKEKFGKNQNKLLTSPPFNLMKTLIIHSRLYLYIIHNISPPFLSSFKKLMVIL